jgi:hypothetical protein
MSKSTRWDHLEDRCFRTLPEPKDPPEAEDPEPPRPKSHRPPLLLAGYDPKRARRAR